MADYPKLSKPAIGTATTPSAAQLRAATDLVTGCIRSIDANAGPALTAAFNAADAIRLDRALQRFDAAARQWLTAPYKANSPCPPPPPPPKAPEKTQYPVWANGIGLWDFIGAGWDFAAGWFTVAGVVALYGFLAIAYALLVTGALFFVPAFITYQFENIPSDLDRQIAIAKLAQALRS